MPYRNRDLMRCDCGGNPVVVQVFWPGTERESRRCHLCCPEVAETEIRALDFDSGAIISMKERLGMRWGDQQERLMKGFRDLQTGREQGEPEEPEPQTWRDRLRYWMPELRNFKELIFWR